MWHKYIAYVCVISIIKEIMRTWKHVMSHWFVERINKVWSSLIQYIIQKRLRPWLQKEKNNHLTGEKNPESITINEITIGNVIFPCRKTRKK